MIVVDAVDDDHRTERAGAQAVDRLEGEGHVGGGLAGLDLELPGHLVEQTGSAAHVACGAGAYRQQMAPARLEAERLVEVGQSEHFDERHVESGRHAPQSLLRKVAARALDVVQGFHDVERLRATVFEDSVEITQLHSLLPVDL